MDELPYSLKRIETPGGHKYDGLQLDARICGVEIVRAGGAMRTSFSRVFVDAPIGKVLIQTSEIGEPLVTSQLARQTNSKLHFLKLPKHIAKSHVILMVCPAQVGLLREGRSNRDAVRVDCAHGDTDPS